MKFTRIAPAFVVVLSGMVAALHVGKIPPAIPVLREALGLTLVEAGFLLSMVQMAGMVAGLFVGVATDSIGRRRSVISGQSILAIASLCGMWAQRPADLLVLRAFEGLGFLLTVLPAPSLIRQSVPLGKLTLYLGLWGTYMPTGTSLALISAPAIMSALGWHGLWGVLAGFSASMALWVFLQVPSEQGEHGPARAASPAPADDSWWQRLRLTLGSAGPWRIAITFSMYSSQWLAVIGFLPFIYAQAGLGGQTAGVLTALACLVNVTGNIAAGRLLHHGVCARHLLYVGFVTMAVATLLALANSPARHQSAAILRC